MNWTKWVMYLCVLFFSILLATGCKTGGQVKDDAAMESPDNGKAESMAASTVYLKNNIHVEVRTSRKGEQVYRSSYANYVSPPGGGHILIPVNTPVTIDTSRGFRGKEILITTQDGKVIHFEFNTRNMGMSPEAYFPLISSPQKTAVKRLSRIDQNGIAKGTALRGMSKEGVRIALGYPAVHRTPSLESDTWIYWRNRWQTLAITFNPNGRVTDIR